MITKDLIKAEIDNVRDEYLEVLYRIVKVFEMDIDLSNTKIIAAKSTETSWQDFVEETYGCLSDDPIKRGNQGTFEIRGGLGNIGCSTK